MGTTKAGAMAEDSDFSLISVNADDEDDVVIQAGAVAPAARSVAKTENAPAAEAPAAAEAPVDEDAKRAAAEQAARARARARQKAEEDANRMITTEEDLHAPVPFASMQRTILIILAVAVILFLVYYFVAFNPAG